MNYGRWRTQIPTRAFESHYENLMQSSLTQTKLTARAFPASRHCPGYLQSPTETPRCSYSMVLWRTVAPQQRHQDREDRLYAGCEIRTRGARKRAPARQPAELLDIMTRSFQVLSNISTLQVSRHSSPTQDTTFHITSNLYTMGT